MKKITLPPKPTGKAAADKWVENRAAGEQPMKRLTIDITESLHRQIKAKCAMRGTKIADELRELLFQKYGKD